MTKVTIDRELLERELLSVLDFSESNLRRVVDHLIDVGYTRAAPRQPEGEGLEVVGLQWLDSGHYRKNPPKYGFNPHDWNELCLLSDAQRAITELRDRLDVMTQCADNYSRMFEESAEECEHWKSGANAEAARADELKAERDTLRQQIAERDAIIERLETGIPRIQEQSHQMRKQLAEQDAEIERLRVKLMTIASAEPGRHNIEWAKAMAATGNNEAYAKWREAFDQRDKLAGLLRDVRPIVALEVERWARAAALLPVNTTVESGLLARIDAALTEVKP